MGKGLVKDKKGTEKDGMGSSTIKSRTLEVG